MGKKVVFFTTIQFELKVLTAEVSHVLEREVPHVFPTSPGVNQV